jgi:putative transposase
MMRTVMFACTLPKSEADALNAESGRIYTDMLVRHYRLYRKQGVWLAPKSGERLEDALGGPTTLHAHSRDAAQQGFYNACKTTRACKQAGLDTKYPHRRKRFRTTIWKRTGITRRGESLMLARARGLPAVPVPLPSHLLPLPAAACLEARLVWDRAARHYSWHLVVEDGLPPESPPQYTAKRLSELRAKQDRKQKGSRRWKRLQRRKVYFLAQQRRRARDMEHKVSRAVVNWAKERQVKTLVIGDVRDVADGKHLTTKSQQKIGLWSHGRQRAYITYKAEAAGIAVMLVDEAYTSQTQRLRA